MGNNTYSRQNGVQIIAKDFITEDGKKLSEATTGGGGNGAASILTTVDNINAKTVVTTPLYTVPDGKQLIITLINIRTTAFTAGGKAVQAIGHIGKTASEYKDWYDAEAVYAEKFDAVDQVFSIFPDESTIGGIKGRPVFQAGDIVTLNIATGSDATLETWSIDLIGYLI